MGRFIAFLLGGLALALYSPPLFLKEQQAKDYYAWWRDLSSKVGLGTIDAGTLATCGTGILVGIALLLFAVRGREGGAAL